jgi:preprotein translocase subunit YajC
MLNSDTFTQLFYLGYTLLSLSMLFYIIYIIYRVIINEKRRGKYQSEMKSGDKVYVPTASNGFTGEIESFDDESVIIKVKVSKSRVYPNEN